MDLDFNTLPFRVPCKSNNKIIEFPMVYCNMEIYSYRDKTIRIHQTQSISFLYT
jgi:hypothetical protein